MAGLQTQQGGCHTLNLTRRSGESLVLQTETEEIVIHFRLANGQIKLAIDAPLSVDIWRDELLECDAPDDSESDRVFY